MHLYERDVIHCKLHEGIFPGGSDGKESACNAGDLCLIPGLGGSLATLSSILAWRIPRTEEPGGLHFIGLQRVRQDWATKTHTHTHTHRPHEDGESTDAG